MSTTPYWGGEVVARATMLYTTVRESTHPPQKLRALSNSKGYSGTMRDLESEGSPSARVRILSTVRV
ncbi:hypothetical protein E2C01_034883 [Portunus trituberculatus]|uniref:Uncharacterized protein n=1 Tax=Portunus trituberculatus TaxID=210409 RepID=A0A5B7F6Q2_PORTR|nr:hypothetical protein [Portunus trituberculatus]